MGVGVARDVEPMAGHLLAMVRVRKQPIDDLFIGIRSGIGDERRHLFRGRRQARQGEGDAADERRPVGLGVERQPLGRYARLEETIDRVAGIACCGRHLGADNLPERPVLFVRGPGRDPAREQVLLGRRKLLAEVGRGHDGVGIGGSDPGDQGAGGEIARDDRSVTAPQGGERRRAVVEPQARFLLAGTMAGEAMLGEQRPDVTIESDRLLGPLRHGCREDPHGQNHAEARPRLRHSTATDHETTHETALLRIDPRRRSRRKAQDRGPSSLTRVDQRGRASRNGQIVHLPPAGLCSR